MRYFLDSGVFMYAAGRDHPLKAPCVAVLRRAASDENEAVTGTEVLQEILHRFEALRRSRRARGSGAAAGLNA